MYSFHIFHPLSPQTTLNCTTAKRLYPSYLLLISTLHFFVSLTNFCTCSGRAVCMPNPNLPSSSASANADKCHSNKPNCEHLRIKKIAASQGERMWKDEIRHDMAAYWYTRTLLPLHTYSSIHIVIGINITFAMLCNQTGFLRILKTSSSWFAFTICIHKVNYSLKTSKKSVIRKF